MNWYDIAFCLIFHKKHHHKIDPRKDGGKWMKLACEKCCRDIIVFFNDKNLWG